MGVWASMWGHICVHARTCVHTRARTHPPYLVPLIPPGTSESLNSPAEVLGPWEAFFYTLKGML